MRNDTTEWYLKEELKKIVEERKAGQIKDEGSIDYLNTLITIRHVEQCSSDCLLEVSEYDNESIFRKRSYVSLMPVSSNCGRYITGITKGRERVI
jgi:hypothetical protein